MIDPNTCYIKDLDAFLTCNSANIGRIKKITNYFQNKCFFIDHNTENILITKNTKVEFTKTHIHTLFFFKETNDNIYNKAYCQLILPPRRDRCCDWGRWAGQALLFDWKTRCRVETRCLLLYLPYSAVQDDTGPVILSKSDWVSHSHCLACLVHGTIINTPFDFH